MPTTHSGCSGYHHRHWRGMFYPAKLPVRRWLAFHSQHFCSRELNVALYRFPPLSFLENWYAQSPAGFQFAVKALPLLTPYRQFHGVGHLPGNFCNTTARGLRDKLGPVLLPLPPRLAHDAEQLARVLACLTPAFANGLEFRCSSW